VTQYDALQVLQLQKGFDRRIGEVHRAHADGVDIRISRGTLRKEDVEDVVGGTKMQVIGVRGWVQ